MTRSPTDFQCITDPFVPEIIKIAAWSNRQQIHFWQINVQKHIACTVANSLVLWHFYVFSLWSSVGSLTIDIDLKCRFSKCRTFTLIDPLCRVLTTACNVCISRHRIQSGVAEISQDCHRQLSKAGNVNFSLPGPCLLSYFSVNFVFINLASFYAYAELESVPPVSPASGCLLVDGDTGMGCDKEHRILQIFDRMSQRIVFACSNLGRTWWLVYGTLLALRIQLRRFRSSA